MSHTRRHEMVRHAAQILMFLSPWIVSGAWARASVVVDGKVGGIAEGYAQSFEVTFDIEDGPTNVAGGSLFLRETDTSLQVGFVAPLTVNDNTYGNNKASDWGTKDHFLMGGGDGLEGSDKWEIKIKDFSGSDDLELKLDYIEHDTKKGLDFVARVEKFKLGSDLDPALIDLHTSLQYNRHVLGLSEFFDPVNPVDSPLSAGPGDYDFTNGWIAEIMYELELQKSAFNGSGFALTSSTFVQDLFPNSVFHMSPNKLGGHKVFASTVSDTTPVVPEPASVAIWSLLGVLGIALAGHRRKKGTRFEYEEPDNAPRPQL